MECLGIKNINFSGSSVEALKDIERRSQMAGILAKILPAGVITNIFLGNKSYESAFNISQTDFVALAEAVKALPAIERKVIRDIAAERILYTTGKEAEFWRGIYSGCNIN